MSQAQSWIEEIVARNTRLRQGECSLAQAARAFLDELSAQLSENAALFNRLVSGCPQLVVTQTPAGEIEVWRAERGGGFGLERSGEELRLVAFQTTYGGTRQLAHCWQLELNMTGDLALSGYVAKDAAAQLARRFLTPLMADQPVPVAVREALRRFPRAYRK